MQWRGGVEGESEVGGGGEGGSELEVGLGGVGVREEVGWGWS